MRCAGLRRAVGSGALLLLAALPLSAQQTARSDSTEEALLEFRVGSARSIIVALVRQDSVYLPLGALFQTLEIEFAYDARDSVAHGYFLGDSAEYRIDVRGGTIAVGKRLTRIAARQLIVRGVEVYAPPAALDTAFGLRFHVDMRRLAIALETTKRLPILARRQRELEDRQRIGAAALLPPEAPLRFPRTRRLLDGGILQYGVNLTGVSGASTVSGQLGLGLELLGGDLEASAEGLGAAGSAHSYATWRYALADRGVRPTRLEVGRVSSDGLIAIDLTGGRISNVPWQPRQAVGTYPIHGRTAPGWEAQLYVDRALVETARADSLGRVLFALPLRYGTSDVEIRYFGPAGEEEREDFRLNIPSSLLPQGALEYSLGVGHHYTYGTPASQLTAGLGITPWLTARAGVDRLRLLDGEDRTLGYVGTSLRLPWALTLNATSSPGFLFRADLARFTASGGALDLQYSRLPTDLLFNPRGLPHFLELRGLVPVGLAGSPLYLRLNSDVAWRDAHTWTRHIDAELAADLVGIRPIVDYRENVGGAVGARPLELGAFMYAAGFRTALARALPPGSLVRLGFIVDPDRWRPGGFTSQASFQVAPHARVTAGLLKSAQAPTSLTFAFSMQDPRVRANSTSTMQARALSVVTGIDGALVADPAARSLIPSSHAWLGQAGAEVRLFMDANGNGVRDRGEDVIPNAPVSLLQASAMRSSVGGTRIEGLSPYVRYSVDVDASQLENPLLAPSFTTFSFIADPNRVKALDVPVYPRGGAEGTVYAATPTGRRPLAGLRVHFRRSDGSEAVGTTFSDGGFSIMGLAPGRYVAFVEPAQLHTLGFKSVPATRAMDILATADGTFLQGIDFVLEPADAP